MERIGQWAKAGAASVAAALAVGAVSLSRGMTIATAGERVFLSAVDVAGVRARPTLASAPMVSSREAPGDLERAEGAADLSTTDPADPADRADPTAPAGGPTYPMGRVEGLEPAPGTTALDTVTRWRPSPEVINPWLRPRVALPEAATAPALEVGSRDPAVRALERRLTELGYRPGEVDEYFSDSTWSAVLAFQKAEVLERSEWVDPMTWARLAAPQAWRVSNSTSFPRVEVDLDRQVVLVVFGPAHVITLNTSTGGGFTYLDSHGGWSLAETPTGSYRVYYTYDGTERAPLGTLYRPLYFYEGYAIHGSSFVPSYPDSHGCVRLSNEDQDWLFNLAPEDLEVTVHETMNPAQFFPGTGARGAPGLAPPTAPSAVLPL